ncbi:MAG: hypothetical protein LBS77_00035 [Desulfovibrio sp.]|nr:hypothetical protein [Desulfovibrio sp.]
MDDPDSGARKCLRSTSSILLGMCVLILVTIMIAYLAGVMRGRDSLIQMAQLAARAESSAVASARKKARAGDKTSSQHDEKILAPEELRFAAVLRDRPTASPLIPPMKPVTSPSVNALASAKKTPEEKPSDISPQGGLYDYVFQVAVLRDEDTVDVLRQCLEGRGLRTRMRRDGKNFVVFVLLRGNEQHEAEVPHITEEMRLGKPLLHSKKAVAP